MPPQGLPGLDPAWSRLVGVIDLDGVERTFHVLDSWSARAEPEAEPTGTLLCVHGNPTWSYLWRRLLASAPAGWRVVAVDQLGMGFSERIDRPRVLAERIDDLGRLTDALGITGPDRSGPVVTVAHDWGGIISLGWALAHRRQLAGVILTNTAVNQPEGDRGPLLIRLAHLELVNRIACRWTPLFVRVTTSLTWPRLPVDIRRAFAAPYRTVARRRSIGEFVADIPFEADHPSHPAVKAIAESLPDLEVPALLLWGPRDPVFGDVYLRDLMHRLADPVLHRYEQASHLLPEDAPDYVSAISTWVGTLRVGNTSAAPPVGATSEVARPSVLAGLEARAGDPGAAVVEVGGRSMSWSELNTRVRNTAAGLNAAGLRPGDRVALMVPPSIELTVALYGVWRAGGVIVVADKGLGLRGMGRALRSAQIDHLVADRAGLLAARLMRLPGRRFSVRDDFAAMQRLGHVDGNLPQLALDGVMRSHAPDAGGDEEAAVLFTSGATGPAKGVLYRHRQVRAQLEVIRDAYGLGGDDRIVAAFAPFALYGPALGVPSAVPRTDVTKPGRLTASALAEAASAVDASVVFASPAALRNVVATGTRLSPSGRAALSGVRLLMSAGSSVPAELLRQVGLLLPQAELHTPYGMTEALPLTDISLTGIDEAGDGDGVCVGRPLAGVRLRIAELDSAGTPSRTLTAKPGITGEIWATAEHIRDRYDARWVTDRAAADHPGWHRTGDVGFLDGQGRLWIQGRLVHVISTPSGPVTPVGIELRVQSALFDSGLADVGPTGVAAVGVGPAGTQQVVVVVTAPGGPLADLPMLDAVRAAAGHEVASVLTTDRLPVDIRHNSKIDRAAVGIWAAKVLAGG
ncbi:acyl-CoA synthetase (AMP-forming)/AMP-acid ligase II/pimeloyl-ACP methyl ester carboxylesterase [Nakamurella sp. UYEF19]|uniref:alpha/beta fold hydrolase n=1 Tax=Nakamurella sp. UYEF19 TaxID=1756392 RepID=UPI00339A52F6